MATLSTEEVIDLLDEEFPEPIMEDSDDDLGLELSDSEEHKFFFALYVIKVATILLHSAS